MKFSKSNPGRSGSSHRDHRDDPDREDESLSDMRDPSSEVGKLLRRMRTGDREAAATFVMQFGSHIRRRIKGQLSPSMRRIFDSRDILSTVGRRLDRIVESGRVKATSEPQLWALVFSIANNAVIEKGRVIRRLRRIEGEDSFFAQQMMRRLRQAERVGREQPELEIERVIDWIDDKVDKEILCLWLAGSPHDVTSVCVNLAPTAVRKRWQKIKFRLRERFETELR